MLGSSHYTQAYALVRLHLIHASVGEMSSGGGFSIYSPLPVTNDAPAEDARPRAETLLAILRRLRDRGYELDYFQAAAEFGAGAVDAAVLGKLLEIRWISSISPEDPPSFARTGRVDRAPGQFVAPQLVPMTPVVGAAIRAGALLSHRPSDAGSARRRGPRCQRRVAPFPVACTLCMPVHASAGCRGGTGAEWGPVGRNWLENVRGARSVCCAVGSPMQLR